MGHKEFAVLWAAACFAALTGFAARIMFVLGVELQPPEDPLELRRWTRRRRWLFASEFAALPMFSTLAVLAAAGRWVSPEVAVMFALAAGALGFAFFTHALEAVIRHRLAIPKEPPK